MVEFSESDHMRPLRGFLPLGGFCYLGWLFILDLTASHVNFVKKEASSMPTYIVLYKLTDQGIRNIKEAPQRIEEGIKALEAAGGKVIGFYSVMGEYDYVSIGECFQMMRRLWPSL